MLKAIIVDDEQLAIQTLKRKIENNCENIKIIHATNKPIEAIEIINSRKPDILFLDIEMPNLDGFQLLTKLENKNIDVIFTSTYYDYIIKAFKANAIDYLLKPINNIDLITAVNKVVLSKQNKTLRENFKSYIQNNMSPLNTKQQKVALPMEKKIILVDQEEILYCKCDGSYTHVFLHSGIRHVISKNLKQLAQLLNPIFFIRIHRSYIVNTRAINEYLRGDGGEVVLNNGKNIPVSRSKKNELLTNILH